MSRRAPEVLSTDYSESYVKELEAQVRNLNHDLDKIIDSNKILSRQNKVLLNKINSVDTLKNLSSLNGLFASKSFSFDPKVVERFQEYILYILDYLLRPLD
jgi:hypothetical protein